MSIAIAQERTGTTTRYSATAIQRWLVAHMAAELGMEPHFIDAHVPLYCYALGGLQSSGLVAELEEWLGFALPPSIFYQHSNLEMLAQHLEQEATRRAADGWSNWLRRSCGGEQGVARRLLRAARASGMLLLLELSTTKFVYGRDAEIKRKK
jgi:hypothetical protein